MTKRFDRNNGKMIHTKTLAGNSPDVYSYEQLITVCGNLSSDLQYVGICHQISSRIWWKSILFFKFVVIISVVILITLEL